MCSFFYRYVTFLLNDPMLNWKELALKIYYGVFYNRTLKGGI